MVGLIGEEGVLEYVSAGSFRCKFLPLSTGKEPVKGQNEAWNRVLDGERKAERWVHECREETRRGSGRGRANPWHRRR